MMITIAVIAIVLGFSHLIYETLLAPSLRLRLKFALFALRDRVCKAQANVSRQSRTETYDELAHSINGVMQYMNAISMTDLLETRKNLHSASNEELAERVRLFSESECPIIRESFRDLNHIVAAVIIVNSLGFVLTLIPVVCLVVVFGGIRRTIALLSLGDDRAIKPRLTFA